jgi:translation initiation factor RLI1
MPFSVREGINIFLAGFVPTENLRFRDEELNFKLATNTGALLTKCTCLRSLSLLTQIIACLRYRDLRGPR